MSYSVSPEILVPVLESTNFSRSVSVTTSGGLIYDPPITSIEVIKGNNTNGDITITVNSGLDGFTISGKYLDNFFKVITYLDNDLKPVTISSKSAFTLLPDDYYTVTEYLASHTTTLIADYAVKVNGNFISTITQILFNNYTPGEQALIAAVAKGKV